MGATARTKTRIPIMPLLLLLLILSGAVLWLLMSTLTVQPTLTATLPPSESWLAENSNTQIALPAGAASRSYRFTSDPARPTLISIQSLTPDYDFAARVADADDRTIAQFDNRLQVAALALAPTTGLYRLTLSSTERDTTGILRVAIGTAAAEQSTPPQIILSKAAPPCQLTAPGSSAPLVRSAPAPDYEVLTTLNSSMFLPVLGRTDDNWYAVNLQERQTWVSGDVVNLVGNCDTLPRLMNPIIPTAPQDPEVYLLEVDRDATGTLIERVSNPLGDTTDIIWIRAINLYTAPPNNYREFALTLSCSGPGAERVRWGSPYAPTLSCGQTVRMPFLYQINQQPVVVTFAANSPQSHIDYTLTALSSTAVQMVVPAPSPDEAGAVG